MESKSSGFTYHTTKNLCKKNNFKDRIFQKFKAVLSMWKMRNLTLYGKVQVIRYLAMSQLLYMCSKIAVPKTFTPKVEKEIANRIPI